MKCQKCGYPLPEDSEFCQYCGSRLDLQTALDAIPDEVLPLEKSVTEAESEVISEAIVVEPSQPESVQEESIFRRAYHSFLSDDPEEKRFFEEVLGSEELKVAYMEECDHNQREYDRGVRVSFKQSYTDFMRVLHDTYFDAPPVSPAPSASEFNGETSNTVTTPTVQTTAPVPTAAPVSRGDKVGTFCKKCGHAIDTNTKKCNGCGKQYFNAKKTIPVVLLSVLLVASFGFNVLQYLQSREAVETVATQATQIEKLEKEIASQKSTISTQKTQINNLEKEVDELEDRNMDLFFDLYFYEEYAAIVPDDGRKRYHIYGCEDCDTSSFWIYNIEAAEQKGYYPCPKCY